MIFFLPTCMPKVRLGRMSWPISGATPATLDLHQKCLVCRTEPVKQGIEVGHNVHISTQIVDHQIACLYDSTLIPVLKVVFVFLSAEVGGYDGGR